MLIRELADRTGVSPRMLRYYEAKGLLAPVRASNRYRQFATSDVERVRRLREMIARGMRVQMILRSARHLRHLDAAAGAVSDHDPGHRTAHEPDVGIGTPST